jgi:hypothetical protein
LFVGKWPNLVEAEQVERLCDVDVAYWITSSIVLVAMFLTIPHIFQFVIFALILQ